MSTQRALAAVANDFQIRLMFASKCCTNFLEYTLAVFTVLQHQHPICGEGNWKTWKKISNWVHVWGEGKKSKKKRGWLEIHEIRWAFERWFIKLQQKWKETASMAKKKLCAKRIHYWGNVNNHRSRLMLAAAIEEMGTCTFYYKIFSSTFLHHIESQFRWHSVVAVYSDDRWGCVSMLGHATDDAINKCAAWSISYGAHDATIELCDLRANTKRVNLIFVSSFDNLHFTFHIWRRHFFLFLHFERVCESPWN